MAHENTGQAPLSVLIGLDILPATGNRGVRWRKDDGDDQTQAQPGQIMQVLLTRAVEDGATGGVPRQPAEPFAVLVDPLGFKPET